MPWIMNNLLITYYFSTIIYVYYLDTSPYTTNKQLLATCMKKRMFVLRTIRHPPIEKLLKTVGSIYFGVDSVFGGGDCYHPSFKNVLYCSDEEKTKGISSNGATVPYKTIFCGDIPLHRPYIGLIYGRYLQFRFLKWQLKKHEQTRFIVGT